MVDIIYEGEEIRVIGNHFVDLEAFEIPFDVSEFDLSEKVYYPVMKEILDTYKKEKNIKKAIAERHKELSPIHITVHAEEQTIVMVTHDLRSALRGSRILYLRDRKIRGELEIGF